MSGDVEFGKCDVCGKEAPLMRKYYHYDIKCECHSPTHFEFVRHCTDCTPEEPTMTKIEVSTQELKRVLDNKKTRIEKHKVCTACLAVGITDNRCVCTYQRNYDTIELEFEACNCCDHIVDDGCPADTEFNTEQIKKLQEKRGW